MKTINKLFTPSLGFVKEYFEYRRGQKSSNEEYLNMEDYFIKTKVIKVFN